MTEIKTYLDSVSKGEHLSTMDAGRVFQIIMSGGATPAQTAAVLMGLRLNGETPDEIIGAVMALRNKALEQPLPENIDPTLIVDTCGTGGDAKGSYNISTAVAFVVAGCGVPVAKHGNKAISSKSGSADVLKALGVNMDIDTRIVTRCLQEAGICFMLAPHYHTTMRQVAPIRLELGIRTIFNILGPLINPVQPKRQLLGVYDKKWVEPMAHVLKHLGSIHAWVVHGSDGMDEITVTGDTYVSELREGEVHSFTISPEDYGIERADPEDLKGGNEVQNAQALRRVLNGEEGAYRDAVLINAAAALITSGKADNINSGMELAAQSIEDGHAKKALETLVAVTNESAVLGASDDE